MDEEGWESNGHGEEGKRRSSYVFHIRLGHKPLSCNIEIHRQQTADGFCEGDTLVVCETALLEISDDGIGVEMMNIWRSLKMRRFVILFLRGHRNL